MHAVSGTMLDGIAVYLVFAFVWHVIRPKLMRPKDAHPQEQAPGATFGWLQADMRVPLPPLAELADACHLIGTDKGEPVFLCATAQRDGFGGCARSDDFSTFYGQSVYVCRP